MQDRINQVANFTREKFFDQERKRWVLKSTREDGFSLQMTFVDEPDKVQSIMHYELIEFRLAGMGVPNANKRSEGFGCQA